MTDIAEVFHAYDYWWRQRREAWLMHSWELYRRHILSGASTKVGEGTTLTRLGALRAAQRSAIRHSSLLGARAFWDTPPEDASGWTGVGC